MVVVKISPSSWPFNFFIKLLSSSSIPVSHAFIYRVLHLSDPCSLLTSFRQLIRWKAVESANCLQPICRWYY